MKANNPTKRRSTLSITLGILLVFSIMPASQARRYSYKMSSPKAEPDTTLTKGSFMVASICEECNNGYTIDQISFAGYDKPQTSSEESFFITNSTDRVMTAVTLYVDYRDLQGRQLTRRFLKISCNIPPGETRQVSAKSWDRQKTFYYEKSTQARRGGQPFTVIFDPVAYYLRF